MRKKNTHTHNADAPRTLYIDMNNSPSVVCWRGIQDPCGRYQIASSNEAAIQSIITLRFRIFINVRYFFILFFVVGRNKKTLKMNFHLDKSRPDRLLAWKQVVRTLVAIIFHTKETWPHNARSSYKAVRKRLCAPFWTSQPYISVCLIMNGTMVNGGVHPAVAIFCHRRPWQCASRDTRNKKKKKIK